MPDRMAPPLLNPQSPLHRLLAAPARPGRVLWIGARPARRAPLLALEQAWLDPGNGLEGNHYSSRTRRSRQVTLIGAEALAAIGAFLGHAVPAAPEALRRNIVVSGINLLALKGQRLRLGEAVLEITGECQPCSRMEEILGVGGYNAVRGHGGLTARVAAAGTVRVGDAVVRLGQG